MDSQNFQDNQTLNILEYVNENLYGLILLVFTFFIIYFVDYINRLNSIIFSTSSPLPTFSSTTVSPQNIVKRKFKKR